MDVFYYFVTHSEDWEEHFHQNFFIEQGGFLWGFLGALIIGVVVASFFYFVFCNSNKTQKYANIGTWAISMLICFALSFLYANFGVIGDEATKKAVFSKSFYQENNNYYNKIAGDPTTSDTLRTDLHKNLIQINDNLDKWKDVRIEYDLTTAFLGVFFFLIASMFIKRFTINGKTIPLRKP